MCRAFWLAVAVFITEKRARATMGRDVTVHALDTPQYVDRAIARPRPS